jgi:hypothetical protein
MFDFGEHQVSESIQSSLFFESHAQIFERVFRFLKPRTPGPQVSVEFCRFANPDSFIRLENERLAVRISDLLESAPAPVIEALAFILVGKLHRKPIPRLYSHRYRLYMNRKDVRRQAQLVRQLRGRKFISGPQGHCHNLEEIFEKLNTAFFDGMLGRPQLGWSRTASRRLLGHFDPSHNAIVISKIFDRPQTPVLALEYVMFHEMLHLRFPVDHSRARRCVHTKEFKAAEKQFPQFEVAKELLKRL